METSEKEKFDANILIEAKLLEQEHRPTHLVLNYINRKKKFPNEKDPRRKAVQRAIIWRLFFSPAVLAVGGSTILGIITVWILIKQTNIIDDQTAIFKEQTNIIDEQKLLLEEQNKKIEIQARLEDANRRNNLVFLMDNVLNRIADELKDSTNKDSSLSRPLLARIQALGHGFQPYKFIDYTLKDSLNRDSLGLTKLYSPERGQLLLSLANSGIGKKTMDTIYDKTSFSSAYLSSARLGKTYLADANLNNANLNYADLRRADLRKTFLREAFLYRADLRYANLKLANLEDVDMRLANLQNANLQNANLYEADLRHADLEYVNLSDAELSEANLYSINLRKANLKNVDFKEANLLIANLAYADLTGANLTEANLEGATLFKANLTDVNLENIKSIEKCLVERKDWLNYIRDSLKLKGAAILVKKYKVEERGKWSIVLKK